MSPPHKRLGQRYTKYKNSNTAYEIKAIKAPIKGGGGASLRPAVEMG